MADAVTYPDAVNFPVIQAVANGKLDLLRVQSLLVRMEAVSLLVSGTRAATTDPWDLTVSEIRKVEGILEFRNPSTSVNPDTFGWKSMADLALKEHVRPVSQQSWPLTYARDVPMVKTVNGHYAEATQTEIATTLSLLVDESGAMKLQFTYGAANPIWALKTTAKNVVLDAIAQITADTTSTSKQVVTPLILVNLSPKAKCDLRYSYVPQKLSGTEKISIGNYSSFKVRTRIAVPATANTMESHYEVQLDAGSVYVPPSIVLDRMRRAVADGGSVSMQITHDTELGGLGVEWGLETAPVLSNSNFVVLYANATDPSSVVEVDFDQANSLNVLAAAAFAGLGGLAAVGTATELERLLANSPLSGLFAQFATGIGVTTSAVITGYVSALIAAYSQGWITNEQLFDLQSHANWIKNGFSAIAASSLAGFAAVETGSLLSYLGVSNDILGMALNAVGGAATSAGVALGVASVMAKAVKHVYLGA